MLNTRRKKGVREINIIQKGKQVYYSTPLPKYLALTVLYPTASKTLLLSLFNWSEKGWKMVMNN